MRAIITGMDYKPISRGLYTFTPFFTVAYFVERLVLQKIYVRKMEILQILGLKSAVFIQERFQIMSEI